MYNYHLMLYYDMMMTIITISMHKNMSIGIMMRRGQSRRD